MKKNLILLIFITIASILTGCDIVHPLEEETTNELYKDAKKSIIYKEFNYNDFYMNNRDNNEHIKVLSKGDTKNYSYKLNSYEEYYRNGLLYTYFRIHNIQQNKPHDFDDFGFQEDVNSIVEIIIYILNNDDLYVIDYIGDIEWPGNQIEIFLYLNIDRINDDNIFDKTISTIQLNFYYNKYKQFERFDFGYKSDNISKYYVIGDNIPWVVSFPDYIDW